MATPHARRRQPRTGLLVGVTALLIMLLILLALVNGTGGEPSGDTVTASPPVTREAATTAPADITMQDLLDRAEPEADGSFDMTITEDELAGAIRNGMAGTSAPVDELRVDVLEPGGTGGRVGFDARLRQPDLPVSGVLGLNVVEGRLEPEIESVQVGGLPIPRIADPLLDDLLREARVLSDELVARGIVIDTLDTSGSTVTISGRSAS